MIKNPQLKDSFLLWHTTSTVRADKIAEQGFLPKGEPRQEHASRAIWFFRSGFSLVDRISRHRRPEEFDGFLIALSRDALDDTWVGQAPNEFLVFQPVDPESILCRFPANQAGSREQLLQAIQSHYTEDVLDRLSAHSADDSLPWSSRTEAAGTLLYLSRDRYETDALTDRAFAEAFPLFDIDVSGEWVRRLASIDFRYYHHFLRDYYFTYGERFLARALLTAAARRIGPDRVVSICCDRADPGQNPVARYLADICPSIPDPDLTLAVMETRVMRRSKMSAESVEKVEAWLGERPHTVDHALYFIEYGQWIFHARYGETAVDWGAQLLGRSGQDHYEALERITGAVHPMMRMGAIQALGRLRDVRGIDLLEQAMDTRWKRMRERVVQALGRIPFGRAVGLVRTALNDRSGQIRKAAEQALEVS